MQHALKTFILYDKFTICTFNLTINCFFQYQSRSSFEDGLLHEMVSTGSTSFQQLTKKDRDKYLNYLDALPKIKKRTNLSNLLLDASGGIN